MKRFFLIATIICMAHFAGAQAVAYSQSDYARKPVWIEMIKDTSVNFFEAEKAFNTYFEHHEKMDGEEEVIGERSERQKYPSKRKQRKMQEENHMRIEVKKYNHWHDKMLPYVQSDGSILTPSQRLQIWKDQQSHQ